jgi:peptidylprolyl isomerase/FKBP-type peptidyl-prolyl cis-trans isomerase FkpA
MRKRTVLLWYGAAGILAAGAVACGERGAGDVPAGAPVAGGPIDVRSVRFDPGLGVDLDGMTRTGDGVYILDVRVGRGAEARIGSTVRIAYRAWLPDGTLFEQRPSPDGFGPSEFVLGETPPVDGLNSGIAGMRAGGVRRIVVPPEHGYGLVGRPAGVPAGSVLVFEVRLVQVGG